MMLITTFLIREFRMTHLITGSLYSQEQYPRKVINHPAGSMEFAKILWTYQDWFRSYKQDLFSTFNAQTHTQQNNMIKITNTGIYQHQGQK